MEDELKKLMEMFKQVAPFGSDLSGLGGNLTGSTSTPQPETTRKNETQQGKPGSSGKSKITKLEKHFRLQGDSEACVKDEKYDEAYGLLTKLIRLGRQASFAPVLVNFYKVLVSTGRMPKTLLIKMELLDIIRDVFHATPKECEILADKYRRDGEHIKAILFYQIGEGLYTGRSEVGEIVNCLQGCILGIKLSTAKLLKQRPDLRFIVTPYIIPAMREIYVKIRDMRASQWKKMILIKALCLHHIETTELRAEDPLTREDTLREAVALMREKLGEEAYKHNLFSAHLNNLAVTCMSAHRPEEAVDLFEEAIKARKAAEDYDTNAERKDDLKMSENGLKKAREMIAYARN